MQLDHDQRRELNELARRAMVARGFLPDFAPEVDREIAKLGEPAPVPSVADLRELLWFSIDNDDSRDLDQLSVADRVDGGVRVRVAIADVDALVPKGSAVDGHARHNTTSVYTSGGIFPMLPVELSYDRTSLNPDEDREAVVIEMTLDDDGHLLGSDVYRALVRNHAKLAYNSVGAWLTGEAEMPERVREVPGLADQIRMQHEVSQDLKRLRVEHGALELRTIEAKARFEDSHLVDLVVDEPNPAKELIENLMVTANGITARFLSAKGRFSLRRVVQTPDRWPRIVEVAAERGEELPPEPDVRALAGFLLRQRDADPARFPDLSLVIVKLLGNGEYALEAPGAPGPGHFGLAVRDYAHSTAPNRRFPDLITQRLIKSALAGAPPPYEEGELAELARHCTEKEDDANKVERQMRKSAAALLLSERIGDRFDGFVSGASPKGTWVRLLRPPVEGKVVRGANGLDVGDRVRVKLLATDVERGFIDFARVTR